MADTETTRRTVSSFFNGFAKGDMDAVFGALGDTVEYTVNSKNTVTEEAIPWSTTFKGKAEVQAFFGRLISVFEVLEFRLDSLLADGAEAGAFGFFKYKVRALGTECSTDWAARLRVSKEGTIESYHFFEDSYAIARAFVVKGQWTISVEGKELAVPL